MSTEGCFNTSKTFNLDLNEYDFSKAVYVKAKPMKIRCIRMHDSMVRAYKRLGGGQYQTLMRKVLHDYMMSVKPQ